MSSSCCSQHSNQYFAFTSFRFVVFLCFCFGLGFFWVFCFTMHSVGVTGIKTGTAVLICTKGSSKPISYGWWELIACQEKCFKGALICHIKPSWWNFTLYSEPQETASKPDFLETTHPFSYLPVCLSHSINTVWNFNKKTSWLTL